MKMLDIEPVELARQLTIMESKLFAKVRPGECLSGGMDGNTSEIIHTSNKIAEWVVDSVLRRDDSNERVAMVEQFVAVADGCRNLQNFSTMAALVAGLNSPSIRQLKGTWEQVNSQSKAQLQVAEHTLDIHNGFTNYRAIIKSAQLPCVPFFGVYLRASIQDEGIKDMIQEIEHYQSKPYNLTVIPDIQDFVDESISVFGKACPLNSSLEKSTGNDRIKRSRQL